MHLSDTSFQRNVQDEVSVNSYSTSCMCLQDTVQNQTSKYLIDTCSLYSTSIFSKVNDRIRAADGNIFQADGLIMYIISHWRESS